MKECRMDYHILCRNCLLKGVIEGKIEGRIEVRGRRERRHKQLLDDLREKKVILRCVIHVVYRINQTISYMRISSKHNYIFGGMLFTYYMQSTTTCIRHKRWPSLGCKMKTYQSVIHACLGSL